MESILILLSYKGDSSMKKFLVNTKIMGVLSLSLCLLFSSICPQLIASTVPAPTTNSSKSETDTPQGENVRGIHPFKRLAAAINTLEKNNIISKDDVKKIMKSLLQISIDSLSRSEDKDQAAADILYRDKILTKEQYDKITELLKATAKSN